MRAPPLMVVVRTLGVRAVLRSAVQAASEATGAAVTNADAAASATNANATAASGAAATNAGRAARGECARRRRRAAPGGGQSARGATSDATTTAVGEIARAMTIGACATETGASGVAAGGAARSCAAGPG